MIYAGIGSRQTPQHVLQLMYSMAYMHAVGGATLRSGGARGADSAFAAGARAADGVTEIFRAADARPWTQETVDRFHPAPEKLSPYVRQLHGRNAMIILGEFSNQPVDFIVCWTPDGKITGGTGQALRIAKRFGIPVLNLGDPKYRLTSPTN